MVGKELQQAREAAGLTQEQAAFRAGLSRPYVSQLERGLKSPTLEALFRLCDALGITASELIGRVERKRKRADG
jgi:transcriptional regulator with XRE-family HTH domain